MDSGINMLLVSSADQASAPVDRQFLTELGYLQNSRYAQKVAETHAIPPLRELIRDEHLRIWDELTVLALNSPQLFNKDSLSPAIEWYSIDVPRKYAPSNSKYWLFIRDRKTPKESILPFPPR